MEGWISWLCYWNFYWSMYIDGYLLFAIYFISVLALALSAYALWSLEEIRKYYERKSISSKNYNELKTKPPIKVNKAKGHWD